MFLQGQTIQTGSKTCLERSSCKQSLIESPSQFNTLTDRSDQEGDEPMMESRAIKAVLVGDKMMTCRMLSTGGWTKGLNK